MPNSDMHTGKNMVTPNYLQNIFKGDCFSTRRSTPSSSDVYIVVVHTRKRMLAISTRNGWHGRNFYMQLKFVLNTTHLYILYIYIYRSVCVSA